MTGDSRRYALLKQALAVIQNPDLRKFMEEGIDRYFELGDERQLRHALGLHSYPVHIEEFMFGDRYLKRPRNEIFPVVMEELININENHGRLINTLTEGVFTGSIGSAKTTTALYTQAYQLYLFSCYKNPHHTFGMDSTSEILFIFQSLSATLAHDVDFGRFKEIVSQSPYFTTKFPFDRNYKSSLKFPNRLEAKPIGSDSGSIGQNVVSGLIDEVNFMAVVQESRKVAGGGGVYDQAWKIYDSVSRRIKTRFVDNGGMPGMLCLVSSRNYPGEFTDKKAEEAKNDPTIYVYDKCVWHVKPDFKWGDPETPRFMIFIGDVSRKPRIIKKIEEVSDDDRHLVMEVPESLRSFFERDPIGSLRDLAGVATRAKFPYFLNVEKVSAAFGQRESVLSKPEHDFATGQLLVYPGLFKDKRRPRWVHGDLSLSGDSTGLACGYVSGFKRTQNQNSEELMPVIEFDFILRITPPKGDEIKFFKIRELIQVMRAKGLPIRWASFDSFQSADSVQTLRQAGLITGYISVDTKPQPYEFCKAAFYDERVIAPEHNWCRDEILALEKIVSNGKIKIDHPPNGSKDCADAVASVIYGLTMRRETWAEHNVPITRIPEAVKLAHQASKDSMAKQTEEAA